MAGWPHHGDDHPDLRHPTSSGRVTLVTGPEEFLNQRAVAAATAAVRQADPESEVSETTGGHVSMAALG